MAESALEEIIERDLAREAAPKKPGRGGILGCLKRALIPLAPLALLLTLNSPIRILVGERDYRNWARAQYNVQGIEYVELNIDDVYETAQRLNFFHIMSKNAIELPFTIYWLITSGDKGILTFYSLYSADDGPIGGNIAIDNIISISANKWLIKVAGLFDSHMGDAQEVSYYLKADPSQENLWKILGIEVKQHSSKAFYHPRELGWAFDEDSGVYRPVLYISSGKHTPFKSVKECIEHDVQKFLFGLLELRGDICILPEEAYDPHEPINPNVQYLPVIYPEANAGNADEHFFHQRVFVESFGGSMIYESFPGNWFGGQLEDYPNGMRSSAIIRFPGYERLHNSRWDE